MQMLEIVSAELCELLGTRALDCRNSSQIRVRLWTVVQNNILQTRGNRTVTEIIIVIFIYVYVHVQQVTTNYLGEAFLI